MDTVFVLFYWEVAPLCPKGTAKWGWWGTSMETGNGEWVPPVITKWVPCIRARGGHPAWVGVSTINDELSDNLQKAVVGWVG
jgi:hypothetical protein